METVDGSGPDAAGVSFAYAGITVAVSASDESHLAWLREFLTPSFEIVEEREPDVRVSVVVDPALFEALHESGPGEGTATTFVLDDTVVELPLWRDVATSGSVPQRRIVYDETFRVFYLVEGREVTVLARHHGKVVRSPLMRVVREFAMNHARGGDAFFLHASAFVVDECAFLVAGPRRAGKTTLLFHALRDPRVRYLSNDRVLVCPGEEGMLLRGMPSILSVRSGTLEIFGELTRRLKERRYHFRSTLEEAARPDADAPKPWSDGRLGLSPAQACGINDSRAVAEARKAVLLFPCLRDGPSPVDLQPLSQEAATDRLLTALFASDHPNARSELFGPGPSVEESPELRRERCRQLVGQLGAFDCFLAPDAYAGDAATQRFIDRLVELRPSRIGEERRGDQ